jgi:hypothetical protein
VELFFAPRITQINKFIPSGWLIIELKESVKISVLCGAKKKEIMNQKSKMNKEIWSKILNIVITVLTAIATTFGVSSCIGG